MNAAVLFMALSLTLGQPSIPSTSDPGPEGTIQRPLSHSEMVELIDLLAAERTDLLRKVALLEGENVLLRDALAKSEAVEESMDRLLDVTRETCDAQVRATELSCDCPSPLLRKVNVGLGFVVGGLAGRGTCD